MSSTLTNLTAATTWSGTDLFYALVGGNSRKIAASSMWVCETANALSDVNGINQQTVRIYRTFTDSSNYERLEISGESAYFTFTAGTAGTGGDILGFKFYLAGNALLQVINLATTGFTDGIAIYAPNASAGQNIGFSVGQSSSAGNQAGWGFLYQASNDATNAMQCLFHSVSGANFQIEKAGTIKVFPNLAMPSTGSTNCRLLFTSTASFGIYVGSGAPAVSAAQGSLYLRSDGSTNVTRMYVNTNGSTTWTAVNTVA